jgi:cardiolipin synthase
LGRKPGQAALVLRDNLRQRRSIERSYLRAIGRARQDVLIANAYFFPSRKLLDALCHAAGRGVQVRLLLQGRYEYFLQAHASIALYAPLLRAGVQIYEYEASFLHAKVAVIDAGGRSPWATVGSSNLDPLSLLLAREANVVSHQRDLALQLQDRLQLALTQGRRVQAADLALRAWHERLFDRLAYALARSMVWLVKDHF